VVFAERAAAGLTVIAGVCAEDLARQWARFLAARRPWPLGRLAVE
jgi:hypothetical protein